MHTFVTLSSAQVHTLTNTYTGTPPTSGLLPVLCTSGASFGQVQWGRAQVRAAKGSAVDRTFKCIGALRCGCSTLDSNHVRVLLFETVSSSKALLLSVVVESSLQVGSINVRSEKDLLGRQRGLTDEFSYKVRGFSVKKLSADEFRANDFRSASDWKSFPETSP